MFSFHLCISAAPLASRQAAASDIHCQSQQTENGTGADPAVTGSEGCAGKTRCFSRQIERSFHSLVCSPENVAGCPTLVCLPRGPLACSQACGMILILITVVLVRRSQAENASAEPSSQTNKQQQKKKVLGFIITTFSHEFRRCEKTICSFSPQGGRLRKRRGLSWITASTRTENISWSHKQSQRAAQEDTAPLLAMETHLITH